MKHEAARDDDFATMFEQSLAGSRENFQPGQLLETTILSIGKDTVFLDLGGKSEGLLDLDELRDQDGQPTVKAGDPIRVFFLQSRQGELHFTTRIAGEQAGQAMLEQAWRNQIPVEGLVEKEIKGGYEVKIGSARAFCPHSQMAFRHSGTPADWVGKHLEFRIQEYKEDGRRLVVSHRAIEEAAHQAKLESLKGSLKTGMLVKGPVVSLQDFGAFVDLGGVQALLPTSEFSRERVADIRDVLTLGQEVEAVIIRLDWQAERISLSRKSLEADPWTSAAARYPEGSRHTGQVARVTTFGVFVTLEPGLDGLVHVSQLKADSSYEDSKAKAPKAGQTMTVEVTGIDVANRRLSLKPAGVQLDSGAAGKYLDQAGDQETYNPFAALLKKPKGKA